jgi:phosphoglycolate phosphatase
MPTPSLILFDLDGTLVDSAPDIARALNATLSEAGLRTLTVAQVIEYVGDGAAKLVERAVPPDAAPAADIAALTARFRAHYARGVCVETRPYPGVAVTLEGLAARGARMVVLTNKLGEVARAVLRALTLDHYFAHVIGEGEGFARKPAPDAARHLLALTGVTAAQALLVGDGLPDVRTGRAVGCAVAAAAWGYTPRALLAAEGPDFIVDDPLALLALVANSGAPTRAP